MDIKRIIPLACLLGVFIWGGLKIKRNFTKVMEIDVSQVDESMRALPSQLSRTGFAQYLRSSKNFAHEISQTGVVKECESYINTLEGLDLIYFGDSAFKLTYQQLTEQPSGCSLTDDLVVAAEKLYLQNCFLSNPSQTDLLTAPCVAALYALRSGFSQFLLKNKPVSKISSLGKLTDLLYADVAKATLTPDAPPVSRMHSQEILDQMLEINPNLKAARRFKFLLKIQSSYTASSSKTLKDQDELWQELAKEFDELQKSNAFDDPLPEYKTLIETRGYRPDLTIQYATKLLAANPNDSWAMFISAYGHWKLDEHETSFLEIRKAAELAPTNENYQQVLTKLTQPGSGAESFIPGLKLGISLQDFDK